MSAILIKSNTKAEQDFILQFAKIIHAKVKVLDDEEELDTLLSKKRAKDLKFKKTVIRSASNSQILQKFLENERQYGELF